MPPSPAGATPLDAPAPSDQPPDPMGKRWEGGVYPRRQKLWLRVKIDGAWTGVPTPYGLDERDKAERMLAQMRRRLSAEEEVVPDGGPVTVRAWGARWLKGRPEAGRWYDESRLRLHVYPALGDVLLRELRPKHLIHLLADLKARRAPRTVRNVYGVVAALLRDAAIEELIPAELPKLWGTPHLPAPEDAEPEWRAEAVFSRDELATLITPHPKIEPDSTVSYALLGLGMLRHGEMAGLRWRHYVADVEPLGRLVVACSYKRPGTKTVKERWMPVHPTLAAILAEWKLRGWPLLMGRRPGPDDLVVPLPVTARRAAEAMRTKGLTYRRLAGRDEEHGGHLQALGFRHRRVHDLRRTGISLACSDGALDAILRWGTHAPPKHIMGLYTSMEWAAVCREVAKLQLERRRAAGGAAP